MIWGNRASSKNHYLSDRMRKRVVSMATVHDVADRVVSHFKHGISTMKLQKLTYFAQGWSFALLKRPLFDEDFRAYRNGPVCYDLFKYHRGLYSVNNWRYGDKLHLSDEESIVVDAVLSNYGALSGLQLSDLTHQPGTPWSIIRTKFQIADHGSFDGIIPKDLIEGSFRQV